MSVPNEPSVASIFGRFLCEIGIWAGKAIWNHGLTVFLILTVCCLLGFVYSKVLAFQTNNAYCVELKDVVLRVCNVMVTSLKSVMWLFYPGILNACKAVLKFLDATWRTCVLALGSIYLFIMCIVSCFTTKFDVRPGTAVCFSPEFKTDCDKVGLSPISPRGEHRRPLPYPARDMTPNTAHSANKNRIRDELAAQRRQAERPDTPAVATNGPKPPVPPVNMPSPGSKRELDTVYVWNNLELDAGQFDALLRHNAEMTNVYSVETANSDAPITIGYAYNGHFIPLDLYRQVRDSGCIEGFTKRKRVP